MKLGRRPRAGDRRRRSLGALTAVAAALSAISVSCTTPQDPAASVVRISDEMCGTLMVGTAVAVGDGRLVTAAHNVVGGDGTVSVFTAGDRQSDAHVTAIDTDRDLAMLVTDLDLAPIATADPTEDSFGTIVRITEDGDTEVVEYTDADLVTARGHDIYNDPSDVGRATVRVVANVQPGWSGAPVVDDRDRMVGMVWAESRSTGYTYAVTSEEVRRFAAGASSEPVDDTLSCAP